jgi:hypothetical protein
MAMTVRVGRQVIDDYQRLFVNLLEWQVEGMILLCTHTYTMRLGHGSIKGRDSRISREAG